jgi:hypothetical protein
MHDTTAIATPQNKPRDGKNTNPRYAELYRRYPTIDYLRRRARAPASFRLRIFGWGFRQG